MQFRVISASVNELPHRSTSDGEQEVGGAIGSDSEGPCHSYSDVVALRLPCPTMHTFMLCMVDEIPMPPSRNPGLDERVGDIGGKCSSVAVHVPAEKPVSDSEESTDGEDP